MGTEFALPESLVVGYVLAPWGTKGEVKVQVETDFPDRFTAGSVVYLLNQPLEIESSRPHKQHLVIKLVTIDSIQEAEQLRGQYLTIPYSELRPLPEDQYYTFQLIGLTVLTTEGNYVGKIVDIMITAANDVYVVQSELGQVLIPAIDDVVQSIDTNKGQMIIEAIEGLLPSH